MNSLACKSEIKQPLGISLALASLNESRLASSFDDNSIKITNDSFQTYSNLIGHSDLIKTLFVYTNDILASGSCDNTIKLWNTTTMQLIQTLQGHTACINALLSFKYLDLNYLISGSADATVKIWNETSNQALFQLQTNHTDSIQALAYTDRLHYLAIGSKDKTFSLWKRNEEYEGINLKTISPCRPSDPCSVLALATLPNSNIVSASRDNIIRIWQSESPYECIANLTGHRTAINALAILPNSSNIVSASNDYTIKIWQSESPFGFITTLNGHRLYVSSLAILPNSNIVSGSYDKTIIITLSKYREIHKCF